MYALVAILIECIHRLEKTRLPRIRNTFDWADTILHTHPMQEVDAEEEGGKLIRTLWYKQGPIAHTSSTIAISIHLCQ